MTTTNDASVAVDRLYDETTTTPTAEEGIWVGVDFGTSNCTCSVWDSRDGRAKWMRLPKTLAKPTKRGKNGRTMPSVVLFDSDIEQTVGQSAVDVVDTVLDDALLQDTNDSSYTATEVSDALVTSVKRILGLSSTQLQHNTDLLNSLPFSIDCKQDEEEEVTLFIRPLNCDKDVIEVTPLQVTAILLRSIRLAAQRYLDTLGRQKLLQVPGSGHVRNCVIGVPAHFGRAQRRLLEQACKEGGWDGHVSTITESTAAAMSYGLFVSHKDKSILVVDIGGGTTDLTIAKMFSDKFQVVVTVGDKQLGGDDMDERLLSLVLEKYRENHPNDNAELTVQKKHFLLRACRRGKEALCGGADGDDPPAEICTIVVNGDRIQVSQDEFNACIEDLVDRARELVRTSLDRYAQVSKVASRDDVMMDEVVLVGGATRVPAVRTMLREEFPSVELCTSISAESAVSQGAAIQAALVSGLVPKHELRSALMLDALPHTIGVQMEDGSFLPILEKDAPLPAMGFATFALANVHQRGVTVVAVENVGDDDMPALEKIGEFTFLLKKLSKEELSKLNGKRSIDIGMTMETSGNFVVSMFDHNDPEHLEKKRLYQKGEARGMLELALSDKRAITSHEEWLMILGIGFLIVMYVVAKLAFHDQLQETAGIPTRQY